MRKTCLALAVAAIVVGARWAPAAAQTTVTQTGGVEIIVSGSEARASVALQPHRARLRSTRAEPVGRSGVALSIVANSLVQTALALVGTPYVWGGASPSGFDCSGLTWYAFARLGISIPRTADQQFDLGRPVAGDPRPGDLVFFQTYDYGASHVGIYLGNGRFVNAIGSDVHVASFDSPYFRSRYLGARRFLPG